MAFFAVQTTTNQEHRVANTVDDMWDPPVQAVLCPSSMTGYVIMEASAIEDVETLIRDITAAKKVLPGETSWDEVKGFLQPKSAIEGLGEGDTVEITAGSFEGDKGKVTSLNPAEEKVTVELVDSVVPIPVELPGDQLRRLESK